MKVFIIIRLLCVITVISIHLQTLLSEVTCIAGKSRTHKMCPWKAT